jgi:dipeptidyl aminopeptidase/acylaminoacyl peptidase
VLFTHNAIARGSLRSLRGWALGLVVVLTPLEGQVTTSEYRRAESLLGWNLRALVSGDSVVPQWLSGDRFWYRNRIDSGHEFVLVEATDARRIRAFDHIRLAAALSAAHDTTYEPFALPFEAFEFVDAARAIRFTLGDTLEWRCDITVYRCTGPVPAPHRPDTEIPSPDGRWVAFVREHDLWIRSLKTDQEIRLSYDGEAGFAYARHSEGWRRSDRPILLWSPDSKKIATYKLDERAVGWFHVLETRIGRPQLHSYRYAIPGDSVVPMLVRYIFHVDTRRAVRIQAGPDYLRTTNCCGMLRDGRWTDVQWSPESDRLFFASVSRDYQEVQLLEADARTGGVRTLLREHEAKYFESNQVYMGLPNWRVVTDTRELIWFSERDDWGHLYLYDARSGVLKQRITDGPWMVGDIVHVDDASRWIYFTGYGREPGRDPYLRHLYRVRFDGGDLALLTPEEADHAIRFAPSGDYFVDTYSRVDAAPVTLLRDRRGGTVLQLETADASRLMATGWQWPERVIVKARDDTTDLHGLLFRPSDFDPQQRYPIIDYVYPGPQVGSVRPHGFTVDRRGDVHALAELGFIVLQLDALGTPFRPRTFHQAWYGKMGDNGLPDHVAAIKQLAERYPQIDIGRVGIYGHSGGGFASTDAILRFPDFFKVAVSGAGNHDNRGYTDYWGEKYQGLLKEGVDGGDNYDNQANWQLASNLSGKLLLMYGTIDDNVHPNLTLLVVRELIAHNKDFDLLVLPNRRHAFSREPYVIRRTWDFFVRHLLGMEPPRGYAIQPPPGEGRRGVPRRDTPARRRDGSL